MKIVEARISHRPGQDPFDNLVAAASDSVRAWMMRKARLADGTSPDLPVASMQQLERHVEAHRSEPWIVKRGRFERDGWTVAFAGLARLLCGASLARISERLELSHSTVSKLLRLH